MLSGGEASGYKGDDRCSTHDQILHLRIQNGALRSLHRRQRSIVAHLMLPQPDFCSHQADAVSLGWVVKQIVFLYGIGVEIEKLALIAGAQVQLPSVGGDDRTPG